MTAVRCSSQNLSVITIRSVIMSVSPWLPRCQVWRCGTSQPSVQYIMLYPDTHHHALLLLASPGLSWWGRLGQVPPFGGCFPSFYMFWFLDAKFAAIPVLKSLWTGWGPWELPHPTQRSRRPYLRIFSEICLFPHASFFIQFQNVLYLPYIWKCISKSFVVLWLFQLAVTFWINCFVWSTSTLCSSTQLHTGNQPFSRNAWLLSQDSDTVTRKYLGAGSDYRLFSGPSASLGA